jgi:predicted CXXCH cytochrome family protein
MEGVREAAQRRAWGRSSNERLRPDDCKFRAFARRGRRVKRALAALVVLAAGATAAWLWLRPLALPSSDKAAATAAPATYVADARCAECHRDQAQRWRGSHHDRAMQPANERTVLGDFDGARLVHHGATTLFSRRDGKFFITTEGPDGKPAEYEVRYTFGVAPLQQYLVAFPGGRLQAPTVAWDTGNKRWFALYPDQRHKPDDPLHATGRYQNWNLMCAECHSTDLRRRYDAASDTYDTKWAELSVGCQACHGPGSAHVEWSAKAGARAAKDAPRAALGLVVDFRAGGARTEIDACAPCHSRRQRLTDGEMPGRPFLDNYRPALLREALYHADGQQQDEVYVWGSFLQSRMYERGVRCTDCHDAHSLALKADGNAVCTQCHHLGGNARFPTLRKANYDTESHHHHPPGSPGAQCVNCHMPAKNYMVIDARADHSLRIPRPDLSVAIGTPNACNGCHERKSAQWAADTIVQWYGPQRRQEAQFGEAIAAGRAGRQEAAEKLAALVADRAKPAIVRATALDLLRGYGAAAAQSAVNAKNDADPLVRAAAAEGLAAIPVEQRIAYTTGLLKDPVRLVRIAAARSLAEVPAARIPAEDRTAFERAYAELLAAENSLADMPAAQLNLASLAQRRGDFAAAEAAYRKAIAMDPYLEPAYNALASFLSSRNDNTGAERTLREGLARIPANGQLHYSLGLLLAEEKRLDEAIVQTGLAAKSLPDRARVHYNLGLMQQQQGKVSAAEASLDRARALGDAEAAYALALLYAKQGKKDRALPIAEELAARYPGNAQVARLRDELRGRPAPK